MNLLKNNILNCPTVLTSLSHEVRTHMNAIVAFSYLMKENSCDKSEREEFSNHVFSSCEQLIGLFDSFLDSALIDTGNSIPESKNCNLDNILFELFSELRESLIKNGHNDVELVTEIHYNNSVDLFIDKARITRVIRNLFQNSLKTTKSGYIKIGYNVSEDKVNFYVIDSGYGYFKSKEFLQTQDMNVSLSQDSDTYTAINLTLARNLIQMMGGSIYIECNGLNGTGIYFSIPSKNISGSGINSNNSINSMIAI
jgi:K+-sensing histidine kinase KdpD